MYLVIKNNYIILSTENEDLLYNIYCSLTFDDKSQAYSPYKGFDPKKIIKIRFARYVDDLDLPSLKIPIGFKYFIKAILEDYEYTEIDDRKKLNDIQEFKMDDIELWEHQKKIIEKALSHYRGIIKSPTGSGKTEAFLAILGSLKNSSLVIFNRKQLTHQSMKRAISRGIDAGIVQGDNVMEKHVTMATIQSIDKIEDITKYKNLILDECHNASSFNYQKILKMDHWLRIYGFSATPIHPEKFTLKSAKIVSNIGNIIANIESKPLIEKKILAKPKIFFIPIFQPDDIFDKTYQEAEKLAIVENEYRNSIVKKLVEHHDKEKVLILTKYINQAKKISEILDVPVMWNKTKLKERQRLLKEFDFGDIDVLVASRILDEGIDIKNVNVVIIASAGDRFEKTIQRLGRGLRVTKKKKSVIIYDFWDETHSVLLRHSKNRKKDYITFGYDDIINIKQEEDIDLYLRLRSM